MDKLNVPTKNNVIAINLSLHANKILRLSMPLFTVYAYNKIS